MGILHAPDKESQAKPSQTYTQEICAQLFNELNKKETLNLTEARFISHFKLNEEKEKFIELHHKEIFDETLANWLKKNTLNDFSYSQELSPELKELLIPPDNNQKKRFQQASQVNEYAALINHLTEPNTPLILSSTQFLSKKNLIDKNELETQFVSAYFAWMLIEISKKTPSNNITLLVGLLHQKLIKFFIENQTLLWQFLHNPFNSESMTNTENPLTTSHPILSKQLREIKLQQLVSQVLAYLS